MSVPLNTTLYRKIYMYITAIRTETIKQFESESLNFWAGFI